MAHSKMHCSTDRRFDMKLMQCLVSCQKLSLPLKLLKSITNNSKYMGAGCGVQCGKECALCCRHREPCPKVKSYSLVNGQVVTSS
jgi:hypothetical protein